MKNHCYKIVVASMFAGLASLAPAQVVSGAVGGATSTATRVTTPPPPPPPTVNANAAAQAATSAATAVRAPASNAGIASNAGTAVSGSNSGVNATGSANAAVAGQVKDVALTQGASHQAGVSVNSAETVSQIQQAAFAQRETVTAEIQGRVDASASALVALEARANEAGDKSRAAFAKLLVEARAREKAVRSSLREAAKATKAEAWGKIQSELAKDYGAYAEIVARAEATVTADTK